MEFIFTSVQNISVATNTCQTGNVRLYHLDSQTKKWTAVNSFDNLVFGGYWINVDKNCAIGISGQDAATGSDIQLINGWNQVGSPLPIAAGSPIPISSVTTCTIQKAAYYNATLQKWIDSTTFDPYRAYLINVKC